MITIEERDFTYIEAEEGYFVTNGETYGKKAFLSKEDDIENWYETEEVTINEY